MEVDKWINLGIYIGVYWARLLKHTLYISDTSCHDTWNSNQFDIPAACRFIQLAWVATCCQLKTVSQGLSSIISEIADLIQRNDKAAARIIRTLMLKLTLAPEFIPRTSAVSYWNSDRDKICIRTYNSLRCIPCPEPRLEANSEENQSGSCNSADLQIDDLKLIGISIMSSLGRTFNSTVAKNSYRW